MYEIKKHVQRFNLSEPEELRDYEAVLNSPGVQILDRIKEKISVRTFSEEGALTGIHDHLEIVVTWQERTLL